jgi:hypothetical protein
MNSAISCSTSSECLPECALADAVLLVMVMLAEAHSVPVVRLLSDARTATHANMGDLDRATVAQVRLSTQQKWRDPTHEVRVRLTP